MEKSKYGDRVLALAAEMAIQQYEKNFYAVQLPPPMSRTKFDPNHPVAQKAIFSIMENYIPAARIAVKHMAEEVQLAMNPIWSKAEKTMYLVMRGLLPSPNQPGKEGSEG